MKRIITLLLVAVLILSVFAGCGGEKKEENLADKTFESFSVGYAKADITPSLELLLPLVGNGDHATRQASGVLERLWATCVAMTDTEGNTVIVFGLDAHSTSKELVDRVREGITKETGIEGKFVQFTASHTHQAAPLSDQGYGYVQAKDNLKVVVEKCVNAAKEAMEDRKAATMSTAFVHVPGTNFVRYYRMEDGSIISGARDGNMPNYYNQLEKSDDLLQIVKFTREGGKDVALLNWQAHYRGHASEDYTKYGSDYMGVLRQQLLDQAGCESVFLLGASGNMTSSSSMPELNTEASATYKTVGENLAKHAMQAMANMTPAQTGKITLEADMFNIQTNPNDYEVSAFGIGDVGFVMMPIEPFQSIGMAVRDGSPFKMTLVGTVANDTASHGYLADAPAYDALRAYGVSEKHVKGDEVLFQNKYIEMLNKCFEKGTTEKAEKGEGYVTDDNPVADPTQYVNIAPGEKPEAVQNGLYRIRVIAKGKTKVLLIADKAVAQELSRMSRFKVTFDRFNLVAGIQK